MIKAEDDPQLADRRYLCVCPYCDEDLYRDSRDGYLHCEGGADGCSFLYDDTAEPLTPEVANYLIAQRNRSRVAARDPSFDEGTCCPLCAFGLEENYRDHEDQEDNEIIWICKNPECVYQSPFNNLNRTEIISVRRSERVRSFEPWNVKQRPPQGLLQQSIIHYGRWVGYAIMVPTVFLMVFPSPLQPLAGLVFSVCVVIVFVLWLLGVIREDS